MEAPAAPDPNHLVDARGAHGAERWERHAADRARLLASLLVFLVGLASVRWRPQTVELASADLARLLGQLPRLALALLAGALQFAAVAAPIVAIGVLVWARRWRLLVTAAATGVAAAGAVSALQSWLDDVVPPTMLADAHEMSWVTGRSFPSGSYLGATAAIATVLMPSIPRRWRRWLVGFVAVAGACRILTAIAVPVNVVVVLALGAALGSLVLVVLGAPTRRTTTAEVLAGAVRAGAPITDVAPVPSPSGANRFTASAGDTPVVVTFVGRDDRDAELMARVVRRLTTKAVDHRPLRLRGITRLKQEALCTLAAGRAVSTPDVLGVGETPDGDAVLVLAAPTGRPLDEVEPTDDDLVAAWEATARLRTHGIAHGALNLAALRRTPDRVVVTGFAAGEVGAEPEALAADVAELLVSSAAAVGVERAVAAAASSPLPREALADAAPLIQPAALSAATRKDVSDLAELCSQIRDELSRVLDIDAVELLDLTRITPGKVLNTLGTAFLAFLLMVFIGNLDTIGQALSDVDWAVLPFLLAMVVAGTFAGGWGLMSAVTTPLPFLQTSQLMLAQSFLNRFTPANAGGMALRARYLQKHGVELTMAATSVGLTSAASGAVQVVLLVAVSLWAGSSDVTFFSLPDVSVIAAVITAVAALGGIVYLVPAGRRMVFGRLGEVVGGAWADLRVLATQPSKIVGLFGSALVSKVTTLAAFVASCAAADISAATSQLVFLYMTANTVASAAPTPGGVGALEAALVAALTGIDVEPAVAVSAVIVFRLATYWAPIPPAYLSLRHLRRRDIV